MRYALLLVAGTAVCGCAAPPKIDHNTPYEGNVSPTEYRHVSGAPIRRNATAEVVSAAAGGVGYAAGAGTLGNPTAASQAALQSVAQRGTPLAASAGCTAGAPR